MIYKFEIAKSVLRFIKSVARSRVGQILFVVHMSLVIFEFAQKTPVPRAELNVFSSEEIVSTSDLIAGRYYHFGHESLLLQFISLIDIPGFFIGYILSLPISYILPPLGAYDDSWLAAIILLCGTSIQWFIIGYYIERVIKRRSRAA